MKKRIVIQLDSEADNREQIIIDWLNKQPKDLRGTRIKEGLLDLIVSAIALKNNHPPKPDQDINLVDGSRPFCSVPALIKAQEEQPLGADKENAPADAFKEAMKRLEF